MTDTYPRHNWPIYGHEWAVDFLRKSMAHGRTRHAYLITGTPGIGKRALAHAFAMALNCTHEDESARPCQRCRSCRLIASGSHPDLLYSELDPGTGALRIESIRNVTRLLALKPYEARYRIAILEDFNRAQPRAQDALLKTLEEPPPHALLIVLADNTEGILSTITSRCQIIPLRPLPADTTAAVLESRGADPEQAELLARLSGGRMGWALAALEDETVLHEREEALDILERAIGLNRAGRFDLADNLGKDKVALRPLLELWQSYWRDVLLLTHGGSVRRVNIDRAVALEHLVYQLSADEALKALQATRRALDQLNLNTNTRLALEIMFLDYPGLEDQV